MPHIKQSIKAPHSQAFTLVELIVVIVILSILATIAFLSFNNYSTSARDSIRMNNVTIISKGLDMSIALGRNINTSEAGTGMNILIVGSGGISYSGYYMNIGNKLLSSIQVSGGDILSDTFQKYQLTYIPDKKYYQVMGLLEKQFGTVYDDNTNGDSFNSNGNEGNGSYGLVNGNIFNLNNLINLRFLSLPQEYFFQGTQEGQIISFDKVYSTNTSSGFAFIKGNFPTNSQSGGYIKGLIPKDYTNAPLINSIPTISGTGDIVIPAEIISSGGGYVIDGDGGTISPSSCAIGSYSGTTTQTYNLPSILNDSLSYTGTYNSGILNGTKVYTATLSCNDGVISVTNETYTGICDTNYSWNGSSCIAGTQVVACSGLIGNAIRNTVSNITQTWNGSSWLPTTVGVYNTTSSTTNCNYKCNSGYNWNGSSCIPTVYTSCNAIKTALPASTDGTYAIDPDGTGGNAAFQVYCDMTTDGGGWTLLHLYNSASIGAFYNTTVFSSDSNIPLATTGITGTHNWNKFASIINSLTILRYTNNQTSLKRYEKNITLASYLSAPAPCGVTVIGGDNDGTKVDSIWNGTFSNNARGNGYAYNAFSRGNGCNQAFSDSEGLGLRYILQNSTSPRGPVIGANSYNFSTTPVTALVWMK